MSMTETGLSVSIRVPSVAKNSQPLARRAFKPRLNEVYAEFGVAIRRAQSEADLRGILEMINLSQGLNAWERQTLKQRAVRRAYDLENRAESKL